VSGDPAGGAAARRVRLSALVLVLCAVNLLVAADFLGASVLLEPIGRDLHMSTATLAWVVNGYLLTLAAPLVAFGRAADAVGAVRLTRLGLVAFAVGAAVTGAATSSGMLIAGRMVQGLGASALTATGLSLVSTTAAPSERGRVVGIWAGVGAIGSAGGPLLAGALAALGSWRIFFLIDVPFAIAVLVFLHRMHDAPATDTPAHIDVVGVACLTLGLGGAVLALLAGPGSGWASAPVIGGTIAAVVLLTVFVVHDGRSPAPLLDRRLFGGARYRVIATVAFVGNAAFAVVSFFASLYLQQVQDLDAVAAGAVFLAMTVPLIAMSPRVGAWTTRDRIGRLMGSGLVVVAVSVALFARLGTDSGLALVVVALVLSGVGQALVFNVSNIAAVDATVGSAGLESGMINEVRQVGALVGLAVFGALFAALQSTGHGSADEVFVAALRLPNLILAVVCAAAGVYAWRSGQQASSAPG
jgi:MFS family permease